MATRLHGILLDGLNKPLINATVVLLAKGNTITVLNGSEAIFRTDGNGSYNVTVQAGHYKVIIGPQGIEPYKAGEIVIYSDSPEGSLNGYLINWAPEEITPDVIRQVQQLVANSEEYALQAGRSAAAANTDATDARNSKAAAAQSSADALVYKNDAKASEAAAKQAQAGAAGSANTANQAVTTIQSLKSDVEQLKVDTKSIKDDAVDAAEVATQKSIESANSAALSGEKASEAELSATNSEASAIRAEEAAATAEGLFDKALLKENNLSDLSDAAIARENINVASKEEVFLKEDNFAGIADRAAAWLNVRPLGATPLSGDPVNDYDAATKRWTENLIGAGTVGPSMNGVMNFGVGQITLWTSRSYIPPYCVTADGQLLKRADWPELWAHAQQHGVVSDAEWLALQPGTQPSYRAKFSSGDGSTTFRVPDLNGVQNGSPKGLFPRGDSGLPGENGKVYEACAPNIEGQVGFPTKGAFGFGLMVGDPRGAFYNAGGTGSRFLDPQLATDSGGEVLGLSAHESDNVYGRYGVTDNIVPRNFVGVWIIRASGGFTAANTKWSVINGGKDVPSPNVNVYGGEISSEYHVNGKTRVKSSIITRYTENGEIIPIVRITDARGDTTSSYDRPVRDAYQVTNAGTGGQSLNIVKNFTRGWQTVSRRFPVTCPPQSATNWTWDFVSEGASTFTNYPGLSVSGESGNSADWDVKCEGMTPSRCSGFIHNRSSATLVVWVILIATGVIASTWKE